MNILNKAEVLKDMVQDAVDAGATNIEEVHKTIAQLPIDQLENLGLIDSDDSKETKKTVNKTIGQIYSSIRTVNQKVGEFATEIFEGIESAQQEINEKDE